MKLNTNLPLCFLSLFLFERSDAGTFIVESQTSFSLSSEISIAQDEFGFDCYEPGEIVRTEEQSFVVPDRSEIRAFAFASLCIQCAPEINGSLHRVTPEGILGESLSPVILDPDVGGGEEPQWIVFELTEPVMVDAGERLAIRAIGRSILLSEDNVFENGQLLSDSSRDLTFRVYSVPEPSASLLLFGASIMLLKRTRKI